MLKISNLKVQTIEDGKEILHDVSLELRPGEVHVLQGKNGSGKSTLAATIAGHPGFKVTAGEIKLVDEDYPDFLRQKLGAEVGEWDKNLDLTQAPAHVRALAGIFLAHQYPLEIPGLDFLQFLRLAYNQHQEVALPVHKFRKLVEQKAALINYPLKLLERNLNSGLSGGEKKKTEILQMAILNPRYVILDETDSGLDKQAIHDVFTGIQSLCKQNPKTCLLVITHYDKVLEYFPHHTLHHLVAGSIQDESL